MTNRFPPKGRTRDEILAELEAGKDEDVDWRGGRIGLYTHFGGDDVLEIAKDASRMYFSENALGASAFPSLARLENDVIAWTLGLLNGGDDAAGSMTSGGTESILMGSKPRGTGRETLTPTWTNPSSSRLTARTRRSTKRRTISASR